jgi:cystathionine gamma-synthase
LLQCRFFINLTVQAFAAAILERFGAPGERAILFPSNCVAQRCVDFFRQQVPELDERRVRIIDLVSNAEKETSQMRYASPKTSAVLFPGQYFSTAKVFWQHTGEGVSSRRGEYCHELFNEGILRERKNSDNDGRMCKGPRRYRKSISKDAVPTGHNDALDALNGAAEGKDSTLFVEERFGRNLELQFTANAKLAIRRRIAGSITADGALEASNLGKDEKSTGHIGGHSEEDIYLYSCGMNAIFNTHRSLLTAKGSQLKSISYG